MKPKAYIVVLIVLVFVTLFSSNVALSADKVLLEYFYGSGAFGLRCARCDEVLQEIEKRYGDQVNVTRYDVMTPLGFERFENYVFSELPAVVINQEEILEKGEITPENLELVIDSYLIGAPVTLPLVVVAGLVDGINPCALVLLVFFLAYLFCINRIQGSILTMGVVYVLGLFATYLSIGLGVLQATHFFGIEHPFSWIGVALMIAFGLVTIADFIAPSKFSIKFPSLAIPSVRKITKKANIPAALMLGILVGLCEFPCTGIIYNFILNYIAIETTLGLAYLVLYNIAFVLPLIAISLLAHRIKTVTKMDTRRLEKRRPIKLISGIFMVILGLLALYWMIL